MEQVVYTFWDKKEHFVAIAIKSDFVYI